MHNLHAPRLQLWSYPELLLSAMAVDLPTQYRALQLETIGAHLQLKTLPNPQPGPGNATIRIEIAEVLSYHREIYNGSRHYSFPTPIVGGINAIGRIAALGPDATVLIPWHFVGRNITLKGKLMYERNDVVQLMKMLERGLFPRGEAFVETKWFGLEDWKAGFDMASEHTGIGRQVVLIP